LDSHGGPADHARMSTIVAFVGQKGGSGKTTAALSVASEWHRRGARVLVVDADPQGSASTWGAVAAEFKRPAPTVIAGRAALHAELSRMANGFEFTIVDCPGRLDDIQRSALMVADMVVVPCAPTPVDVWALQATLDVIDQARSLRPELQAAVLITKRVGRTSLAVRSRQALIDGGVSVLAADLGHRVAFQEALAAGTGPTTHEPRGAAAAEVKRLCDELALLCARARTTRAPDLTYPQPSEETVHVR
jgi:chromosome partitioning protein